MKVGVKFPTTTKKKRTRPSKYEFLLDGRVWLIEPDDFPRALTSVQMGVHMIAKSRGVKVRTKTVPDEGLYVQALKSPAKPRPASVAVNDEE